MTFFDTVKYVDVADNGQVKFIMGSCKVKELNVRISMLNKKIESFTGELV